MNHPALRLVSTSPPTWPFETEAYRALRAGPRATFRAIVEATTGTADDGSLIGAAGGVELVESAGCSRGTFWRHLAILERDGLVVCTTRGGTLDRRTWPNIYGVPRSPGALDSQRADRPTCRMARSFDGKLSLERIRPGDQITLWHRGELSEEIGPSLKLRLGPKRGAPVSGTGGVNTIPVSGAPQIETGSGRPSMRDVRLADLVDTGRLLELFEQAVGLGLVGGSADARLQWVGMAEHVRRVRGIRNRPAAFVANVRSGDRWSWITIEDERRAADRIRAYFHADDLLAEAECCPAGTSGGVLGPGPSARGRGGPGLGQDRLHRADLAGRARADAAESWRQGRRISPLDLIEAETGERWTAKTWSAAIADYDGVT